MAVSEVQFAGSFVMRADEQVIVRGPVNLIFSRDALDIKALPSDLMPTPGRAENFHFAGIPWTVDGSPMPPENEPVVAFGGSVKGGGELRYTTTVLARGDFVAVQYSVIRTL